MTDPKKPNDDDSEFDALFTDVEDGDDDESDGLLDDEARSRIEREND